MIFGFVKSEDFKTNQFLREYSKNKKKKFNLNNGKFKELV
jgi:hypothetical protein